MMASFRFRAARADGSIARGTLSAADAAAAEVALIERSLVPIRISPASATAHMSRRLPPTDLATGFRTLASLLSAGLPVTRALAAFEDVAPPTWRDAALRMKNQVRHGESLTSALERSGVALPPVILGVVRAGEISGQLGAGLTRAAVAAESSAQLSAAMRGALAYPIVLATIGSISVTVVAVVILPRFSALVADMGGTLPPLAAAVMSVPQAARAAWWPSVIVLLASLGASRFWLESESGRRAWHAWLLSVPIVGRVRVALASSRVCAGLAALLDSGVPMPAALSHAARASGDHYIEGQVHRARELVVAGASLSQALGDCGAVTTTARRLARSGEETGRLAEMLQRASELDAELAAARVRMLVRLLEPALIVFFAAIIALVAAALLQAVYAVRPA